MASKLSLFLAELKRRKVYHVVVVFGLLVGCRPAENAPLTVEMPLHLEEHLDAAVVVGSEIPDDIAESVEWRFDEPQTDWKATPPRPFPAGIRPVTVSQTDDALQITLGPSNENPDDRPVGGVYVDVPEWDRRDWAHVVIRARSSGPGNMRLGFNVWDQEGHYNEGWPYPYEKSGSQNAPLVGDGTVQTYQLPLESEDSLEAPVEQLGLWLNTDEPLTLEILSITVVPLDAVFAEEPAGVRHAEREDRYRRSLFVHTPAQLEYRLRVPEGGRLDTGIGTMWSEPPTTFRVTVRADGKQAETAFEESHGDRETSAQHSIGLSAYAGQVVTLSLEAKSERDGSVAIWGAPTLTGSRAAEEPNIIFYVIDGAGADYMSVYGYNRRTTPNIERLAAEGAVFEHAYSNSSWTRPSNASFMTSLQHSVLGGFRNGFNVVPENAPTMAQHMHRASYQTAAFTGNPNAGRMSGLERGVDIFQEAWAEFARDDEENWSQSSKYMHEAFWTWREEYPGEPYWVHFQTIDVHEVPTVAPFLGLFVSTEQRKTWGEWTRRLVREGGVGAGVRSFYSEAYDKTGLSRVAMSTVYQGLYDENMAHNDYQLGRLVERLKAEGEWENTLLIVAADHSIAALRDTGIAIQDSLPPRWSAPTEFGRVGSYPMFRASISRIPLIFVWPGHIAGGQRFSQPVVSMIDVLPTILDLAGLPMPEVMQGQSLAPLLLGGPGWEPRPVILDEFEVDRDTGKLRGRIEVIDGRWGASLEINPDPERPPDQQRPVPVLLYDLWNDPLALHPLNDERPDLVQQYTAFLEAQFEAHKALSRYFTPGEGVVLTPEQLRTLRALGYIR